MGEVRVLNVRIDWHVKRTTDKKVKRRAVQSQAGERLSIVFSTPPDPIGFRTSTRDVETQIAPKEHTSKARGDNRGPGVRGSGEDLGQRWSR